MIQLRKLLGAPGYLIVDLISTQVKAVQVDWDYPSLAENFGWSLRDVQQDEDSKCNHNSTDGTVKCVECGLFPSEFIAAAASYLDENIGRQAEDPGYFS